MQAGRSSTLWLRATSWVRSACVRLGSSRFAPSYFGGMLLGVLACSTWLTWTLTWGDQRAFVAAGCLMLGLGVFASPRLVPGRSMPWTTLAGAACIWTLLQPVWLAVLTLALRGMPVTALASQFVRLFLGLGFAAPTWLVCGVFWSRFLEASVDRSAARGLSPTNGYATAYFGIAHGIGLNAFLLAAVCGVWWTAAIASVATVAVWLASHRGSTPLPIEAPMPQDGSVHEGVANWGSINRVLAAVAIGSLIAGAMRLVGQLMPNGLHVGCAEWMGILIGYGCGRLVVQSRWRPRSLPSWPMLLASAWCALLLAAMPALADASLWMNASLTWVSLLLTSRSTLLIAAVAPLGAALAGLKDGGAAGQPSRREGVPPSQALSFAVGLVSFGFWTETDSLVWTMAICCAGLVVLSVIAEFRANPFALSWRAAGAGLSLGLVGLSVPLWRSHDDPARVAKLLFSTPAFVAHRSGWESHLLPMLDDTRMVFHTEGPRGPLTLWRSRGAELHLRENGVPRSVISSNTETHPQFPPEVLQAVLPLVIADQPSRVLLLGASGGVPLAACLHFPVREAVCIEGDAKLIEVLRGSLARETGFDPLADDRVTLIATPPELALMARDDAYDVILSSPPPSSVMAGAASFTVDYYRRASQRLTERGIFCQRFECIDYGPAPLRMTVQSLRQAFREVIAVETAAGEMLLMATNSPGVFIPDDLPARLEAPHVRKLLARSGLDWSTPLNFPAYDHAALGEICNETLTWSNTSANGLLAATAPLDVMRWGTKLQDVQQVLTAVRLTPAPFWNREGGTKPNLLAGEAQLSRKSRFLEWLGDENVSADLLRRLSEVASQQRLVRENPESHWWEYRKALREELKNRPRSSVKLASHVSGEKRAHPEDLLRKTYFEALGEAAQRATPTRDEIAAIEACLEPYDPLLSYFARQEIADLQARGGTDATSELAYRLHVIFFAPTVDASTRNVATALELLVRHPETVPDDARRFDLLNGLVQTMRTRWESRQNVPIKSARRQLTDVDRSVVAIEKAVDSMTELTRAANVSSNDWATRKQVIDRILLRPLRSYRAQLQAAAQKSESQTRAVLEQAGKISDGEHGL